MTSNGPSNLTAAPETSVPARAFKRRAVVISAVLAACMGLVISSGIHSRVAAETRLRRATQASAITFVDVVYPKVGSEADEIALPGNTQAFNDTPIYARTSGYVKHWYADIGGHAKQGQLLAVIETP